MEEQDTYDVLHELMAKIPELQGASAFEPIHKGYSTDLKFKVRLSGEKSYLLRIYEWSEQPVKQKEYRIIAELHRRGVRCPQAISLGQLNEQQGYMLLSYIDGEDAEEVLPRMDEQKQRSIGIEAGGQLQRMHELQIGEPTESWYMRKSKKHQRYVDKYHHCPIRMRNDQAILAFIEENMKCMKNRPDRFQHDDFHPGNLIVKDERFAGVIDFNRYDQGDPVHEFLKLGLFASETSTPYSIGQIQGYFNGGDPDELFWRMYSLYMAMALISSVVWIQQVKPEETEDMMAKIERVREDHDDFRRWIPRWYNVKNY